MPYLLDGNNLIGLVRRTPRPSEEDRAALVAEIAGRLRRTRARATLFFDGPAGDRGAVLGGLTVRTPSAGSADEAILREVAASRSAAECVVVTADRQLSRRARELGARVSSPQDFFARFGASAPAQAAPAEPPSTAAEVEEWIRYFEDDRNRK